MSSGNNRKKVRLLWELPRDVGGTRRGHSVGCRLACWFGVSSSWRALLLRVSWTDSHVRNDFIHFHLFLLRLLIPLLHWFFSSSSFSTSSCFSSSFRSFFFPGVCPSPIWFPTPTNKITLLVLSYYARLSCILAYSMTHNECLGRYILFYFVSLLGRYNWQILPTDAPSSRGRRWRRYWWDLGINGTPGEIIQVNKSNQISQLDADMLGKWLPPWLFSVLC